MKLAVIGSRGFNDFDLFDASIRKYFDLKEITDIISGGAVGADSFARLWTEKFNEFAIDKIALIEYIPNWNLYGKRAGFLRNEQIISAADQVLAFWDGESRGTANSLGHAKKQKKNTVIVYF